MKPIFSVIIPTYHRNDLLAKCLACLKPTEQTLDVMHYEVIVTDDGHYSTAEELIRIEFPWVYWVQGPKKGPAANRNNGAKAAQGEWLVFTDDDCLPKSSWLEAYWQMINQERSIKAMEGKISPDFWNELAKDMSECPVNVNGGCFWSANICLQKNLFYNLGGFDEQFLIAAQEDQDLYLRVKAYTTVEFVANAEIVHPVRITSIMYKIKNMSRDLSNWMKYAYKHDYLYKKQGIISFGFSIHASTIRKDLLNRMYKKVLLSSLYILFGIPYVLIKKYSKDLECFLVKF
ncbi:MAG: glycosyl transferase family 2 [Spirosoma sp.]|nr:glycosyl transferase family 2 [Spirosoma sp.]